MNRLTILLSAAVLVSAATTNAEVAVERGENGSFLELRVIARDSGHWGVDPSRPEDDYLNEAGDDTGDGAPRAVVLPPQGTPPVSIPLVVWTHHDGLDIELYYSVWRSSTGWDAPTRLTDNAINDLDPELILSGTQARLSWWREAIPSHVAYNWFDTNWHTSEVVSQPNEESFQPSLSETPQGDTLITYHVRLGPITTTSSLIKERFDPD